MHLCGPMSLVGPGTHSRFVVSSSALSEPLPVLCQSLCSALPVLYWRAKFRALVCKITRQNCHAAKLQSNTNLSPSLSSSRRTSEGHQGCDSQKSCAIALSELPLLTVVLAFAWRMPGALVHPGALVRPSHGAAIEKSQRCEGTA